LTCHFSGCLRTVAVLLAAGLGLGVLGRRDVRVSQIYVAAGVATLAAVTIAEIRQ
jgi:hypothetical protein